MTLQEQMQAMNILMQAQQLIQMMRAMPGQELTINFNTEAEADCFYQVVERMLSK
jgi:hypothetical protein